MILFDVIDFAYDFPVVAVLYECEHIGKLCFTKFGVDAHDSTSLLPIIDMMLRWGDDHFEVFEKKFGAGK